MRQADVGPTRTVLLIPTATRSTQPTLDLCNGTYPSERLRTARLQVVDVDSATAARDAQHRGGALPQSGRFRAGVRGVAQGRRIVSARAGDESGRRGNRRDGVQGAARRTWPQTPTVERQAYSMVSTTRPATSPGPSIAVYLRRGRALLGLYFTQPSGSQPAVAGQRTIEGIVGVFAARWPSCPLRSSTVHNPTHRPTRESTPGDR